MADRQVEFLTARLAAIGHSVNKISTHLADLHAIAYERSVTGEGHRNHGEDWLPAGVETHGDEHARELWHRLEQALEPMELSVRALDWAVGNLLSQGGSVEETRGSLIARADFRAALKQQRARRERGDYTPTRTMDQPPYPGTTH